MGKNKAAAGAKPASEMESANRMMIYIMPLMLAFFTASAPAGVGIYWAFSTLYGIIQQIIINRNFKKAETQIEVINAGNNKSKKELYKKLNEERKTAKPSTSTEPTESDDNSDKQTPITIIKA
jgi:YidC/Oxa1 family membrane protein insertase